MEIRARKEITSQFGLCETKPNRSEYDSRPNEEHHSQIGKGDEEDRLGAVAASPNREVISLRALNLGILALQGGFAKHAQMVKQLGYTPIEVRYQEQLDACQGLIIPGGESTTLIRHIEENALLIREFPYPIFGTCAGLILLAFLGLIDVTVKRNGYGRQYHSFSAPLNSIFGPVEGIFIRAPRLEVCSPQVKVLAEYQNEPVCIQQGYYLAASFHPELTNDPTIHQYFIQVCKEKLSPQLL